MKVILWKALRPISNQLVTHLSCCFSYKQGEELPLLVHSPNGCNNKGWVRQKPKTWDSSGLPRGHFELPSQTSAGSCARSRWSWCFRPLSHCFFTPVPTDVCHVMFSALFFGWNRTLFLFFLTFPIVECSFSLASTITSQDWGKWHQRLCFVVVVLLHSFPFIFWMWIC